MRKSRYKIEIVAMAITYYWVLFAPNGEPIAESYSHYSSPSNAKRAARNAVLAMCTKPIIIGADK